MKVKVQTLDAKAGGDIQLDDAVFGVEPRADILHRVVTWQLINRRAPARAARERSEVARTGKKFGRQKGGGTARHGDRRAPIFVGGGKATTSTWTAMPRPRRSRASWASSASPRPRW
jgi:large subunit ribosomal protein L4